MEFDSVSVIRKEQRICFYTSLFSATLFPTAVETDLVALKKNNLFSYSSGSQKF